jgi:hypothetical protein
MIGPVVEDHRHPPLLEQSPGRSLGGCQRCEGVGLRSLIGVPTIRGDMDLRRVEQSRTHYRYYSGKEQKGLHFSGLSS